MLGILSRDIFRVGHDVYRVEDALLFAALRGEWGPPLARLREALAGKTQPGGEGKALDSEEITRAGDAFRYERGLISADETHVWLEARELSVEAWTEFLERSLWRDRDAGDLGGTHQGFEPDPASFSSQLWAEVICSGELSRWCRALAARAAFSPSDSDHRASGAEIDAMVKDAEPVPDCFAAAFQPEQERQRLRSLASLELHYRRARDQQLIPAALERCIETHRLDWIRVDARVAAFAGEPQAREARLRVEQDGEDLDEVARDAGVALRDSRVFVEDCEAEQRVAFVSATTGELIGPLRDADGFSLFAVDAKVLPDLADPAVRERAEARVWEKTVEREITRRVRWVFQP